MGLGTAATISLGAQVGGTVLSYAQSIKQARLEERAATESKEMMRKAEKLAEKDRYAGLNVSTEAYDTAFDNNLQAQTQNIQALQEGDPRNLAAGVGAVQQYANANAESTRLSLQKDLESNAKMKADSATAVDQDLKAMYLGRSKDAEKRAKDAAMASASAISQSISGIGGAVGTQGSLAPLFGEGFWR